VGTVSLPLKSKAAQFAIDMLHTAMGAAIVGWLNDPAIVEIMLNPDGRLWIDRLAGGLEDTGKRLSAEDGDRFVKIVANHVGGEVTPSSPRISGELPETKARFEGLIPPIVEAPTFAIRKPAVAVFTLVQYTDAGIITADQADLLRDAVAQRRNILVAGGTSTGKTKVTIVLPELLKEELDAYAAEHSKLYEPVETAALIPHMLEAFLRTDRGWCSRRKQRRQEQTRQRRASSARDAK
jgi:Flp pilus assembly CpaF family ATPase